MVEPINKKESKFTPAPPNYSEEPPYMESEERETGVGMSMPKGESLINKVIPIGLAVLVSIAVVGIFFSPVKKDIYQADITRLETDLVAMRKVDASQDARISKVVKDAQAAVTSKTEEVDDKVASALASIDQKVASIDQKVANATSNFDLSNYATKSDLSGLNSEVDALEALLAATKSELATTKSELTAKIGEVGDSNIDELWEEIDKLIEKNEELEDDIIEKMDDDIEDVRGEIYKLRDNDEDLEDAITALEEEIDDLEVSSSSSEPVVSIVDLGNTGFISEGYDRINTYKITIENDTNSDIEITELWILLNPTKVSSALGGITSVRLTTMSSSIVWASVGATTLQFLNHTSIDVEANDKETIFVEARIEFSKGDGVVTCNPPEVILEDWEKL